MNDYSRHDIKKILDIYCVTYSEAQDILGISKTRLYQLIREGKLNGIHKDGVNLLLKEDVTNKRNELQEARKKYRPYEK